jgi:hypothetical protein
MAQDHRAPRADVVEIFVAINVVEIGSFGASDEDRLTADRSEGTGRAVHPAGNELFGFGKGGSALVMLHEVTSI